MGIIGTGNRGSYLMRVANKVGGIQWVAVCDAWDVRRDKAEKTAGVPVAKSPIIGNCWTAGTLTP